MAAFLLLEDFRDFEENSCLLHIPKLAVYGGAKHFHGWRERHICVDERRDILAVLSDGTVQYPVVVFERLACEHRLHIRVARLRRERVDGGDQVFSVGEMLVEKSQ